MTRSVLAMMQAAATLAAIIVGIMLSAKDGTVRADAPAALLVMAEVIKIISAIILFRLIGTSREPSPLLRRAGVVGAILLFVAGAAGLLAVTEASPPNWARMITPLALASVILTAIWAAALCRAIGARALQWIAIIVTLAAAVALYAPPVGMIAGLGGLLLWAGIGRALRSAV